jgi:hypothetical protein
MPAFWCVAHGRPVDHPQLNGSVHWRRGHGSLFGESSDCVNGLHQSFEIEQDAGACLGCPKGLKSALFKLGPDYVCLLLSFGKTPPIKFV